MTQTNIKVSVLMMAYNQEAFIAQAIESILMQETDFTYELVIGEDHSPDGTLKICLDYQDRFPDKVRVLQRPSNLGMHENFVDTYKACLGQYIALCEGDDYWTDPEKLQIQADLLDNNDDYVIVFHPTKEIALDGSEIITNRDQCEITDVRDVIRGWYIRTPSYMFRHHTMTEFPNWYYKVGSTDQCFHILLTQDGGKIKFINRVMSVYRRNEGGIMHGEVDDYKYFLAKTIDFYGIMKDNLPNEELRDIAKSVIFKLEEELFYALRSKASKSFSDLRKIAAIGWRHYKMANFGNFLKRKIS